MIDRNDKHWYLDAIFYQLHIKSFFDADNDGAGDFQGLIRKLDYIKDLGANTIWVLPFYPSPLKDDGYDIADYRNVNPTYGTIRDFRHFVHEAHERNLRVVTELVINHTSDQHPWFQRARRAKPGSVYRNYYVWSDTDQRFSNTRIIFSDTESSNWAWDPVAKQYYWHRFYSHQPDLNFDNPRVVREVINILHFWLSMGVDGLRLDAVPYLCVREGTNNENLPETHAVIKRIRREVDARYPDRMLLAEANQWPEDAKEYFGAADECHMAFHFPLMPRMYMAIAQEDRYPITDIMYQTPDAPQSCQWGLFLRNHDELTLEMVTDTERDYLWNFYATDRRMRLNLGIRRRLLPLMSGDRRKVELLHGILLSFKGTPFLYYGDEIGMGDNIFLGDRDGVRTPMQWSPDRNGGFSRANPQQLCLPPIMDPIYSYEAVNVEAQSQMPFSLLNWLRRLIALRNRYKTLFGRGSFEFLHPGNRKVLAYLRQWEQQTVLCLANLSRAPQPVDLDLSAFKGRIPIELLYGSVFPQVGSAVYSLMLGPYAFHWFLLAESSTGLPSWLEKPPEPMPAFATLIMRGGWKTLWTAQDSKVVETQVLPTFLPKQRWFAGKEVRQDTAFHLGPWAELPGGKENYCLMVLQAVTAQEAPQRYLLPLAVRWGEDQLAPNAPLLPSVLTKVRRIARIGALFDALAEPNFSLAMAHAIQQGLELPAGDAGHIRFSHEPGFTPDLLEGELEIRKMGAEQSNTSVILGNQAVLKVYRRLRAGVHPEIEMGRFLTSVADFHNIPALLGEATMVLEDEPHAMAILQRFVENQGDAWQYTIEYLARDLEGLHEEQPLAPETGGTAMAHESYLAQARLLGQRTGEMHRALLTPTDDPAFSPEPVSDDDVAQWSDKIATLAASSLDALRKSSSLTPATQTLAKELLDREQEALVLLQQPLGDMTGAVRCRIHGDYHLGQVLLAQGDFFIVDFEGEPERPLTERRMKVSPLKDVAGMIRSFDYAAAFALRNVADKLAGPMEQHAARLQAWAQAAIKGFLDGHSEAIATTQALPTDQQAAQKLLRLFVMEKVFYEIGYELANRPAWVEIPLKALLRLLDESRPGEESETTEPTPRQPEDQ